MCSIKCISRYCATTLSTNSSYTSIVSPLKINYESKFRPPNLWPEKNPLSLNKTLIGMLNIEKNDHILGLPFDPLKFSQTY